MDKDKVYTDGHRVVNDLAKLAHRNARKHGFYDDVELTQGVLFAQGAHAAHRNATRDFVLAQLAKIASEVGETVSAIQHDLSDEAIVTELADVCIRAFDLAEYIGVPIGTAIVKKMRVNEARPYKHGKSC